MQLTAYLVQSSEIISNVPFVCPLRPSTRPIRKQGATDTTGRVGDANAANVSQAANDLEFCVTDANISLAMLWRERVTQMTQRRKIVGPSPAPAEGKALTAMAQNRGAFPGAGRRQSAHGHGQNKTGLSRPSAGCPNRQHWAVAQLCAPAPQCDPESLAIARKLLPRKGRCQRCSSVISTIGFDMLLSVKTMDVSSDTRDGCGLIAACSLV
jgi:hypothetical protein